MRILHSKSGLNTLITLKVRRRRRRARAGQERAARPDHASSAARGLLPRQHGSQDPRHRADCSSRASRAASSRTAACSTSCIAKSSWKCCRPNIPDSIEVDVSDLGIGDAIHVRDLAASAAWEPVSDADMMIVHVVTIKVVEEAPAAAAGAEGARGRRGGGRGDGRCTEPEVIKKGKTDKEDAPRTRSADSRCREPGARKSECRDEIDCRARQSGLRISRDAPQRRLHRSIDALADRWRVGRSVARKVRGARDQDDARRASRCCSPSR